LLAANGAEAVEVFRREHASGPISLVILDASMPHLSGLQACRAIRELDSSVPVLFASGHPDADVPVDPGTGFLQKPFTPNSLTAAVRKILTRTP
jgi:DNA-binding response OmpR family regulator